MAADKDFLNHVMDLLAPLDGISNRAMFGGFGIFHEGDMFALITNSGLHFKVNETNLAAYQEPGWLPALITTKNQVLRLFINT